MKIKEKQRLIIGKKLLIAGAIVCFFSSLCFACAPKNAAAKEKNDTLQAKIDEIVDENVTKNDEREAEGNKKTKSPTPQLTRISATDTVEHLFTHNLIAHPETAFQKGNSYGKNLDEDCITPREFRAVLRALYENDYVLINAAETYQTRGENAFRVAFDFPAGKKPLILSFDDVVYARKNQGKGTASRIDVQDEKIIAVTVQNNGEEIVHGEEFAPILEEFIAEHPDFSFHGARGIIFLTGFDGILGYRTDRESKTRQTEIRRVLPVIQALKRHGWVFGCHSYAHAHMKKCTEEQVKSDLLKWKNEVETLVGKTSYYAYPYGEWEFGKKGEDKRQIALKNAGYRVFFGVGNRAFYAKMPLYNGENKYLFQDRCPIDGISLRKGLCERFFDCDAVYDATRPILRV